MSKYLDYEAVCLNGTIKAGDNVMTTPAGDYPCMRGKVLYIYPKGSPEQMEESANEDCDNVHVEFFTNNLSLERIGEIEDFFSKLYGSNRSLDDIALDDDIEGGDVLININGIPKSLKKRIDQSESSAREAAFCLLADYYLMEDEKSRKHEGRSMSKEFNASLFRDWIEGILENGAGGAEERIGNIFFWADRNNTPLWPVQDIPDAVLRIAYGVTDPINREVLADMAAHGKAKHWLESLGVCNYRCRHGECDGIASTKTDPQNRPCAICAKWRVISFGLLQPKNEGGAV